jgi:hypothetical protein
VRTQRTQNPPYSWKASCTSGFLIAISLRRSWPSRSNDITMPMPLRAGASRRSRPDSALAFGGQSLDRRTCSGTRSSNDRAHLVAGSSKYDLRTLPIADFPGKISASEPVEFSLSAAELRAMIKSVAYAALGTGIERHYLQGVNLHVSGEKLITVATDTVRLAVKSCPLPDGASGMPRVTVPTETASAMVDLLKDVEGRCRARNFSAPDRATAAKPEAGVVPHRRHFP